MELPEILLIDKPTGITSFDVIRILRKETGIRKFGHAGTLDPLASGLMILGVEKGTKKLESYIKLDKEYIGEIRIGEKRSTGDLEGFVLEEKEVEGLTREDIESALAKLIGTQILPVSAYSAIKNSGVPLYKKARAAEKKGETITDIPLRSMEVFAAELLDEHSEVIDGKKRHVTVVRFHVASGTYIRSLAEELGRLLHYPATLQALRRTKIGEFKVEDARDLYIQKEAELN
jgi:tRNA pseudouridine55 synthase